MRSRCLVLLAAAVLAVGLAPPASGSAEDNAADALFRKINNKRFKVHDLNRLEEWSVIVDEAKAHSVYQAQQGKISHDGFNGRANRIQAAGSGINGVCENVAYVSGVTELKAVVRIIYRGWDKSPGHHACMFDEDFKTTWGGVGVEKRGSTWYATYLAAQDSSPGQP